MQVDYLPLAQLWPRGLPRTPIAERRNGAFKLGFGQAINAMVAELGR